MSGSIREKYPGVWQVRYAIGRDPVTGDLRRLSKNVKGTKREAQKVLNAMIAEADAGRLTATSAVTFRDLTERWLAMNKRNQSPTTQRTYRNLLENRVYPALGRRSVSSIRTEDLDHLYDGLVD